MDFDQQLVVLIKAFLNASDLTDSPTARELYNAYLEAHNAAVRRLLECEVLIRKKQKIEALLVAQREPRLFETIDLLMFPGHEMLSELADLYDWPMPDAMDPDTLREVRKAIDEMDAENQVKTDRLRAREILARIGSAYGAFDTVALEDAISCWNELCRDRNYQPDEEELLQFNEANGYLNSEKKKTEEKRNFQQLLDKVAALIDENAPLDEVERNYAAAEAMGMEIPAHIADRAAQYRLDLERERRTAAIIKVCRIIGTAAVVIVLAVGISIFTVRTVTERRQAANLLAAVRSGDISKARSLLLDLEKKHPKLARSPRIAQARSELAKLEEEEKRRVEELQKLFAELDELLKPGTSGDAVSGGDINRKLKSARKLAKSAVEQQLLQERSAAAAKLLGRLAEKDEDRFMAIIPEIRTLYKQALEELENGRRNGNFEAANRTAERVVRLCREAKELPALKENLLTDYKEVLACGDNLQASIAEADKRQIEIVSALRQISEAKTLQELEDAQRKLEDPAASSAPELAEMSKLLKRDAATLRMISDSQNNRLAENDAEAEKTGYFADSRRLREYRQSTAAAREKLIAAFGSLQKNTNGQKQIFIRFACDDGELDIYASGKYAMMEKELTLTRVDDVPVKIVRNRGFYYDVSIAGKEHRNCRLIYPKLSYSERLTPEILSQARAAHQLLIEKFFKQLPTIDDGDILGASIDFLKEIRASTDCSPYWKMLLSLRILEAVAPLDQSTAQTLPELLKEMHTLNALDDGSSAPMYNKILLEKITLFFDNYDSKKLSAAAEANQVLLKLLRDTVERSYRFLGTSFSVNGFSISSIVPDHREKSGDVWCFDTDGGGCLIVGYFKDNRLMFHDRYRDFANGKVLFTTDAGINMMHEFKKLKGNKCGIDVSRVAWPEFWPSNMRGGEKL